MKNVIKKFDVRKFRMAVIKMAITACTFAMMSCCSLVAFAEGEGGGSSYATAETKNFIGLAFWILRGMIFFVGGGLGLYKIVQGKAEENPRDSKSGIGLVVLTGLAIAGTFVVEGYMK